MLTPLILFLGLTVATAIIAYWSDNLGKKLGKKRVTLFGLRPRTTATVLTISSSWVIMIVTLAVLLIVVAPLRNALFRYDHDIAAARENLNGLLIRFNGTQSQLLGTKKQLALSRKSIAKSNQQLEKTKGSLQAVQIDLAAAKKAEEEGKKRTALALQGERRALDGVENAKRRVELAQTRYQKAQNQFLNAQTRAHEAQNREAVARRGELEATRLRDQARKNLNLARKELSSAKTNLSTTNSRLGIARQKFLNARNDYVEQLRENLKLSRVNLKLNQDNFELLNFAKYKDDQAYYLGGGDIEIPVGRTFAAGIIESGKSQKRIEENLKQLFAQGREGIRRDPLDLPAYVDINLLPLPVQVQTDGNYTFITGDAIIEKLAGEIAKNGEATSVRLITVRNVAQNEISQPIDSSKKVLIDVRFVAVTVATAFRTGEELASISIDGTAGDAGVFNKLLALTDRGRDVAIDRKVNPPQSPTEQNFYASGTNVALFAALRRIEGTGKTVKVRLIAADDLSTVEPLRVRFEIEGVDEPSTTSES